MADKAVPLTMEVNVRFLLFGQLVENLYHVRNEDGVDAQVLSDCRDAFIQWVPNSFMPNVSHDLIWQGLEVKNLNILNGSILSYTAPSPVPGGANSASEPGNVSFCVSKRTGQSGRSFRGRTYVAGVPVVFRTGNSVDGNWASDVLASLNELITILNTFNQVLVVVSKIADKVERLIPITTQVINFTYADLNIDSQRRRLTGRGA